MSDGASLLRMLEPAVRPGGSTGPTAKPSTPFESRPFESLLEEAQSLAAKSAPGMGPGTGKEAGADVNPEAGLKPAGHAPLQQLAQLDRIENPALLKLISGEA
ncbi:MAG: hypothetical protein NTW19_15770 [Planctomycetota bacterium]|nr:hypothetical protein [Planctomycetota bacterium]